MAVRTSFTALLLLLIVSALVMIAAASATARTAAGRVAEDFSGDMQEMSRGSYYKTNKKYGYGSYEYKNKDHKYGHKKDKFTKKGDHNKETCSKILIDGTDGEVTASTPCSHTPCCSGTCTTLGALTGTNKCTIRNPSFLNSGVGTDDVPDEQCCLDVVGGTNITAFFFDASKTGYDAFKVSGWTGSAENLEQAACLCCSGRADYTGTPFEDANGNYVTCSSQLVQGAGSDGKEEEGPCSTFNCRMSANEPMISRSCKENRPASY